MFASAFIFGDCSYRASLFTRNRDFDNGMIWANLKTFATVNAFVRVYMSATFVNGDCLFRTVKAAGLSKTTTTNLSNHILRFYAG